MHFDIASETLRGLLNGNFKFVLEKIYELNFAVHLEFWDSRKNQKNWKQHCKISKKTRRLLNVIQTSCFWNFEFFSMHWFDSTRLNSNRHHYQFYWFQFLSDHQIFLDILGPYKLDFCLLLHLTVHGWTHSSSSCSVSRKILASYQPLTRIVAHLITVWISMCKLSAFYFALTSIQIEILRRKEKNKKYFCFYVSAKHIRHCA